MIPYATLLGHQMPQPRPDDAPVRTVRLLTGKAAPLEPITPRRLSSRSLRTLATRKQVLEVLRQGDVTRRGEIAAQCGIAEYIAGDRLAELRELGLADYKRVGRDVTWHATMQRKEPAR